VHDCEDRRQRVSAPTKPSTKLCAVIDAHSVDCCTMGRGATARLWAVALLLVPAPAADRAWPMVGLPDADPAAGPPPRDPAVSGGGGSGVLYDTAAFAAAHGHADDPHDDVGVHVKQRPHDRECPVPAGRWMHTAVYLAGSVYVFGGVDADSVEAYGRAWYGPGWRRRHDASASMHALLNDVWSYAPATGYWREVAPDMLPCAVPVLRDAEAAALVQSMPLHRPASVPDPPAMRKSPQQLREAGELVDGVGDSGMPPPPPAQAVAAQLLAPQPPQTGGSAMAALSQGDSGGGMASNAAAFVPAKPTRRPVLGVAAPTPSGAKPGKAAGGKSGTQPRGKRPVLLQVGEHDGGELSESTDDDDWFRRRDRYAVLLGLSHEAQTVSETRATPASQGTLLVETESVTNVGSARDGGASLLADQSEGHSQATKGHRSRRRLTTAAAVESGSRRRLLDSGAEAWLYGGYAESLLLPGANATGFANSNGMVLAARRVVYTPADALWQWDLASQRWLQPASAPRPTVNVPVALVQGGVVAGQLREGYSIPQPATTGAGTSPAPGTAPARTGGKGAQSTGKPAAGGGGAGGSAPGLSRLPPEVALPSTEPGSAKTAGKGSVGRGGPAGGRGKGTPTRSPSPGRSGGGGSGDEEGPDGRVLAFNPDLQYPGLVPAPRPLNAPAPRWLHTAVAMARGMVVFGGVASHDMRVLADVWHYDPEPPKSLTRDAATLTMAEWRAGGTSASSSGGKPAPSSKPAARAKPGKTAPGASPAPGGGDEDGVNVLPWSREAQGRLWTRVWPLPTSHDEPAGGGLAGASTTGGVASPAPAAKRPGGKASASPSSASATGGSVGLSRSGASDASLPGVWDPLGPFTGASGTAPGPATAGTSPGSIPPPLEGHTAVVIRFPATPIPPRNTPPSDPTSSAPPPQLPSAVSVDALPPAGTSPDGSGEVMLVFGGLPAGYKPGRTDAGMAGLVWAFTLFPTPGWQAHYQPTPAPTPAAGAPTPSPASRGKAGAKPGAGKPQATAAAAAAASAPVVATAPQPRWLHAATVVRVPTAFGSGATAARTPGKPAAAAGKGKAATTAPGSGAPSASGYEDVMVVFGGCDFAMRPLNDVWLYRYATNTWKELLPHGYGPAPRWMAVVLALRSPSLPPATAQGAGLDTPEGSYYAAMENQPSPETIGTPGRVVAEQPVNPARATAAATARAAASSKPGSRGGGKRPSSAGGSSPGRGARGGSLRFADARTRAGHTEAAGLPSLGGMLTSVKGAMVAGFSKLTGLFKRTPKGVACGDKFTELPIPLPSPPTQAVQTQEQAIASLYGRVVDEEPEPLAPGVWDEGASPAYLRMRRNMGLDPPSFNQEQWEALQAQADGARARDPKDMDARVAAWQAANGLSRNGTKPGAAKKPGIMSRVKAAAGKVVSAVKSLFTGKKPAAGGGIPTAVEDAFVEVGAWQQQPGSSRPGSTTAKPGKPARPGKKVSPTPGPPGANASVADGPRGVKRLLAEADVALWPPTPNYRTHPDAAYGLDPDGAGTTVYVYGGSTASGVVFGDHFLLHLYPLPPAAGSSASGKAKAAGGKAPGGAKPAAGSAGASSLPPLPTIVAVWEQLFDVNDAPLAREGSAGVVVTSDPRHAGIPDYAPAVAAALVAAQNASRLAAEAASQSTTLNLLQVGEDRAAASSKPAPPPTRSSGAGGGSGGSSLKGGRSQRSPAATVRPGASRAPSPSRGASTRPSATKGGSPAPLPSGTPAATTAAVTAGASGTALPAAPIMIAAVDGGEADIALMRRTTDVARILQGPAVPPSSYAFAPYPAPLSQWVVLVGGAQHSHPVAVAPPPPPATAGSRGSGGRTLSVPLSVHVAVAWDAMASEEQDVVAAAEALVGASGAEEA